MKDGLVIFLNGTSSSGKTSISKELLKISNHDFMHLSVDDFSEALAKCYGMMFPMFNEQTEEEQKISREILTTPLVNLFHATIRFFVLTGKKIIVDHVIEDEYWLDECLNYMGDLNVIFVGVQCPLEELERRERARGNRHVGLAKFQYDKVHSHGDYDLVLNTFDLSPHDCAMEIWKYMSSNQTGYAFRSIQEKRKQQSN